MNGFWQQTLSGALGAILAAAFTTLLPIITRPGRWKGGTKVAGSNRGSGAQALVTNSPGSDVTVTVDAREKRVLTHISQTYPPAENNSTPANSDVVWLEVAGVFVTIGLMLWFTGWVFWASVVVAAGLVVGTVWAIVRASRAHLWTAQAAGAIIGVVVALTVTVWTWVSVFTTVWNGLSIVQLQRRVHEAAAVHEAFTGSFGQFVTAVLAPIFQLGRIEFPFGLTFAAALFLAAGLSFAVLLYSWSAVFDWLAYVGFAGGGRTWTWLGKRAYRHAKQTWKDTIPILIAGVFVLVLCAGPLFWLIDISKAQASLGLTG